MAHGRPAKKRRLSSPVDHDKKSETINSKDLFNRAAEWDLEQAYEERPRKRKDKESTRLPIKTAEGTLEQVKAVKESDDEADSFVESDSAVDRDAETPPTEDVDGPQIPLRLQIVGAKEDLARIALLINEDPEEHAGAFKSLGMISQNATHPTIKKLALATQATVYKDVIPGYRIRAYKEEDMGNKVSKDVRKLRHYEQALVSGYQNYVKDLLSIARSKDAHAETSGLRSVAINCACTMLTSVPHFNFRRELLKVITAQLASRRYSKDFQTCVDTVEVFFAEDDDGAASLEAVTMLAKMMKAKGFHFQERVLNTFFHLRLLTELSVKSSTDKTDRAEEPPRFGKKPKTEWQHRSKKDRKLARERQAVEKEMEEADASVSYEARDKMQSETLKLVFTTYFRILKQRVPELMGAVLEGLAKFAHLINQDFFGDLLEALKDLVTQAEAASVFNEEDHAVTDPDSSTDRSYTRESLLSTQTAFTLLSQQDVSKSASSLSLDLSFFTSYIYRTLHPLSLSPDLELGPKSLHLEDPHSSVVSQPNDTLVNVSMPSLLLLRILHSILLPTHVSTTSLSPTLIASFTKRLLTCSLHTPEKSTLALLSLLNKVTNKHGRKVSPLWYSEEKKGDGVFKGDAETVDGTRVWSGGNIWEGEVLRLHYCPRVRDSLREIEASIKAVA